jgi:hypothetical protein
MCHGCADRRRVLGLRRSGVELAAVFHRALGERRGYGFGTGMMLQQEGKEETSGLVAWMLEQGAHEAEMHRRHASDAGSGGRHGGEQGRDGGRRWQLDNEFGKELIYLDNGKG